MPSHALPEPEPFARAVDHESAPIAAILAAAEGCFAQRGYAGASMREIAEAADVSKSLLHYHFESKEHLFAEVQMRAYNRLAARITAAAASARDGAERGLVAFDAFFDTLRASNDLGVQAELWSAALSNARLRVHVVRMREHFRALLVRSIEQILGADHARLPFGVEAAADLVWAALNGIGQGAAFGEPAARGERAIAALRALTELTLVHIAGAPEASPASAAGTPPATHASPRASAHPTAPRPSPRTDVHPRAARAAAAPRRRNKE